MTWNVFDIPVYGTITTSIFTKAHPAIVFVAGSGPTDRNWCSPLLPGTNGSAKLLAEALANQGFVTLRYDKLASGPHVRENVPKLIGKISMQSHVEELKGAVKTLVAEKNVDNRNLFVISRVLGACAFQGEVESVRTGGKPTIIIWRPECECSRSTRGFGCHALL